jgi:phenylalanyl-tRNA synthetase beta chain
MMVISDDQRAGIAGRDHGRRGVGRDRGHDRRFLESAYWDPITIAATGRALKINSDARYRFERGVDPAFTLPGLDLATR